MMLQTSNTTFPDRESFLNFLATAPAIPELTTLDVFHDCNRIAWYWSASGMKGSEVEERGVHLIYTIDGAMADLSDGVTDSGSGPGDLYGGKKVNMVMFEMDSLGWRAIEGSN